MQQPMIVGKVALVVVDIQQGGAMPADVVGIHHMEGVHERVRCAERLVAAARGSGVPIIFFQEVHRRSGVDFGRELDGAEGRHCVDGAPGTSLWPTLQPDPFADDREFHIVRRARRTTDEVVEAFAALSSSHELAGVVA